MTEINYWRERRVMVTGGRGFLGRHLTARLRELGAFVFATDSKACDLRKLDHTREIFGFAAPDTKPQPVLFHLAARVSGIGAISRFPASSLYDNLTMGMNALQAAADSMYRGKIVLAGSVCAYPKYAPQPMVEANLWEGYPEESNGPYGVAKRTLSVAAEVYRKQYGMEVIYPLLANLYGPGDNHDALTSHVIPALFRKMIAGRFYDHETVEVWGSGTASRDFLYVEDAVDALILCAEKMESAMPINIGTGQETPIAGVVEQIRSIVGYTGKIVYDRSKPDGQPRRSLQTREAKRLLGWEARTKLDEGLRQTYDWIAPLIVAELEQEQATQQEEDDQLRKFGFRV